MVLLQLLVVVHLLLHLLLQVLHALTAGLPTGLAAERTPCQLLLHLLLVMVLLLRCDGSSHLRLHQQLLLARGRVIQLLLLVLVVLL